MRNCVNFVFKLIIFFVAAIGVARFCHHATKGFRLSKIQANLLIEEYPAEASAEEREFVTTLFKQKFHYIGRGLQSFVFASEDEKYVLKLFNNRYQEKIKLFSLFSHFPLMSSWAASQAQYYQGKLVKTFKSYEIAFDEMRDKTGLIYTHLSPTSNLPSKVSIIDPLNICHEIDPNASGFSHPKKQQLLSTLL